MSVEDILIEAYREWRRLAEAEGEAIRTCNWSLCAACQKALQHLRDRITALMPGLRAEWSQSGCNRAAKQQSLDETIHELIHLERDNQTLLQSIREATQTKLKQFGDARFKLKKLRRTYGLTSDATRSVLS
jgi:hypothetical protein